MILTDSAPLYPAGCAIRGTTQGPFVDLLRDCEDLPSGGTGRLYFSVQIIRDMALAAGLPVLTDAQRGELEELRARVGELEGELESLREFERAAEYTLERFGKKVQKKPGRKPAKQPA